MVVWAWWERKPVGKRASDLFGMSYRRYTSCSSGNVISNSVFLHTFLLCLILHAENDRFSLSSPPPNSWPKLLSYWLCWALSLSVSVSSPPLIYFLNSPLYFLLPKIQTTHMHWSQTSLWHNIRYIPLHEHECLHINTHTNLNLRQGYTPFQ